MDLPHEGPFEVGVTRYIEVPDIEHKEAIKKSCSTSGAQIAYQCQAPTAPNDPTLNEAAHIESALAAMQSTATNSPKWVNRPPACIYVNLHIPESHRRTPTAL